MWYFTWILGLGLALTFGVLNGVWYEFNLTDEGDIGASEPWEPTMTDHAEPALELISFCIGEQEFCIDVKTVREIRGWTPATPIPHAPSFLKGVINRRDA